MSPLRFSLIIALFLLGFFREDAHAQNGSDIGYYLGVRADYGFLWAHRPTMSHLVNKHVPALEVTLWKNTGGAKCWHTPYHYPQPGVTLVVMPLGDERLGTAIGLYPFINFPLAGAGKKLNLDMQLGWGVGWLTRKFDPIENHKNNAIGSHLNGCMHLGVGADYQCTESIMLEAGFGIDHFSNGSVSLPNLGLNIPVAQIGAHFRIFTKSEVCTPQETAAAMRADSLVSNPQWHFTIVTAGGLNDIGVPGGNRFGVLTMQTSLVKNTARKHRFGGGVDLMYSQGIRHTQIYDGQPVSVIGNVQVGTKFAYELVLGRLYLPVEFGVYVYSKYKENGPIYNRLSVRYLVNDHFVVNVSLKTHLARAEYWETGIGWRI